jgi:tetratricopeptide (TPR) repeat protein
VSREPTLPRARQHLVQALIGEARWDEAKRETDELRNQGAIGAAAGLEAVMAANLGDYGEAGWWLSRGLAAGDTTTVILLPSVQQIGSNLLAGAGRVGEAIRFARTVFGMMQIDSLPGPGGVQVAKDDLLTLVQAITWSQTRYPVDSATAAAHRWLDVVERRTAGDTAARRTALAANSQTALLIFLAERDTTLLGRIMPYVSDQSIIRAQAALERGDTADARRRALDATGADPAGGTVDPAKVPDGAARSIWALGWGDLLGRLGQLEAALAAYAYADSAPHPVAVPGALVQSWAERGALLQQLGRTQEAITQYQRFIDAWDRADPGLQPLVERARRTVAALRGEVEERRS